MNNFGTTPLSPDEMQGLKLTHITTQEKLNRWEQDNITQALLWLDLHKPKKHPGRTIYQTPTPKNVRQRLEVGWQVSPN